MCSVLLGYLGDFRYFYIRDEDTEVWGCFVFLGRIFVICVFGVRYRL